jgi:hypothetical protein
MHVNHPGQEACYIGRLFSADAKLNHSITVSCYGFLLTVFDIRIDQSYATKECEVEVTAVYEAPAKKRLTPTVEIRCKDTGEPHFLTTKKSFATEMQAELFGAQMAREWIDENVK